MKIIKDKSEVENHLNSFLNQKCNSIEFICDSTYISIGFGQLVYRMSSKELLSSSGKIYLGSEYRIIMAWNWRLCNDNQNILTNRLNLDVVKNMNYATKIFNSVRNLYISDVVFNPITNDLQLVFSNGYILETFNDTTKYVIRKSWRHGCCFQAINSTSNYIAQISGKILYYKKSTIYFEDFEDLKNNPDKYSIM